MDAKRDHTEVINAWLVPSDSSQPLIPLGTKSRVLGYDATVSDVVLKNICSARRQTELSWDGENVCISDFGGNGLTILNGEPVLHTAVNVYQDDTLSLAGEEFSVVRKDGLRRPELKFNISFLCEGEELGSAEHKKGEEVRFPDMPAFREENEGVRVFEGWTDSAGGSVTKGLICDARDSYTAVYRDWDETSDSTTMSGKDEIFLCNCETYFTMKVPSGNFKFGGSRKYDCLIPGANGLIAELCWNSGEFRVYRSGVASVNGKLLDAGDSTVVYEMDKVGVAGRYYNVIGHKKTAVQPEKVPVLYGVNGSKIRLDGLTEGKTVALGRDYQKILSNIFVIGHEHAKINKRDGRFYISDANSKNGTFVIKAGSEEERQLTPGEEIQLDSNDTIRLVFLEFSFCLE